MKLKAVGIENLKIPCFLFILPCRANILAEFKVLVLNDPKSEKFLKQNFLLDDNYVLIYLRFIH